MTKDNSQSTAQHNVVSKTGFFQSVANNIPHTMQMGYYTALGMFSQIAAQQLNKNINPPSYNANAHGGPQLAPEHTTFLGFKLSTVMQWLPLTVFGANTVARLDENSKSNQCDAQKLHHTHEIIAENFVNGGAALVGVVSQFYFPTQAAPFIGLFLACELGLSGDNSPVDQIKSNIALGLDSILGGSTDC